MKVTLSFSNICNWPLDSMQLKLLMITRLYNFSPCLFSIDLSFNFFHQFTFIRATGASLICFISHTLANLFFFDHTVWHGGSVPWPGIKFMFPALEVWILNHWTTRHIPLTHSNLHHLSHNFLGHLWCVYGLAINLLLEFIYSKYYEV